MHIRCVAVECMTHALCFDNRLSITVITLLLNGSDLRGSYSYQRPCPRSFMDHQTVIALDGNTEVNSYNHANEHLFYSQTREWPPFVTFANHTTALYRL